MMCDEWRPIEQAPLGEPVFVNEGDMICFGYIESKEFLGKPYKRFCGSEVQAPVMYGIDAEHLVGWQPAGISRQKPKSGEELLADLGYKRRWGTNANAFCSRGRNEKGGQYTMIELSEDGKVKKFCHGPRQGVWTLDLTVPELLAVAQLIEERKNQK